MATDGSVTINATVLSGTLTITQVWSLHMPQVDTIAGTFTQTWTDTTLTGQLVVTANLLPATRQANVATRRPSAVPGPAGENVAHAPGRALTAAVQAISEACCSPRSYGSSIR